MATGSEQVDLDETTKLADTYPKSNSDAKTKARADKMCQTEEPRARLKAVNAAWRPHQHLLPACN